MKRAKANNGVGRSGIDGLVERRALLGPHTNLRCAVEFEDTRRTAVDHFAPVAALAQQKVGGLGPGIGKEERYGDAPAAGIFRSERVAIDCLMQLEDDCGAARFS